MNELLKGLIGAELTLLGVPSSTIPTVSPERSSQPKAERSPTIVASDSDTRKDGAQPGVKFSQEDYRTAAG